MLLKRLALVGASLVLVGGMSAACGDDGDTDDTTSSSSSSSATPNETESEGTDTESEGTEPEGNESEGSTGVDADAAEFCKGVIKAGTAEGGTDFKAMQDAWEELYAVGAPSDISDEEAAGFKWYYEVLTKNTTQDEARKAANADADGMADFETFKTYVTEKCA